MRVTLAKRKPFGFVARALHSLAVRRVLVDLHIRGLARPQGTRESTAARGRQ